MGWRTYDGSRPLPFRKGVPRSGGVCFEQSYLIKPQMFFYRELFYRNIPQAPLPAVTFLGFGLESKLSDSQLSKCSESHQQGAGLGKGITFALFAICYKDFLIVFETYPALRAPLSERGGCRITILYISIGCVCMTYHRY